MKRVVMVLISILCLTACNEKDNSQIDSTVDSTFEEIVIETTDYIIDTEKSTNENQIMCNLNEIGLDINYKGDYLNISGDAVEQFREAVSQYEDVGATPQKQIVFQDFNFDGYEDLFIPTMLGTPNIPGVYYKYNSSAGIFQNWNELNKLGVLVSVREDALECNVKGSAVDHEKTVYKWDDNKLKKVSSEVQYASGSDIYIDTFEYDERQKERFIKREQLILSDDGTSELKEIEISSLYDFEIDGNNVNLLKNNVIVQTLECDYPPDEQKIIFCDYDFDSYEDIFVSVENGAIYADGTYFRYNPDTQLYEKCEHLNEVGREMTADEENQQLYWVKRYGEEYLFEKYVYEWKYDKLKCKNYILAYEDEGGLWTKTYSFNDYGKKFLESQEKEIYDENGNKYSMNPDNIYFRSDDNGINVMIRGKNEPLQYIEGDFVEKLSEYEYAPEYYISNRRQDLDFDGFIDLFIPENLEGTAKGVYYRFNPQTFQFDYWDELNEIGYQLSAIKDIDDSVADCEKYYILNIEDENYLRTETIKYKWFNQKLIPFERIVYRYDEEQHGESIDVYSIDEYGNEILKVHSDIGVPYDDFCCVPRA